LQPPDHFSNHRSGNGPTGRERDDAATVVAIIERDGGAEHESTVPTDYSPGTGQRLVFILMVVAVVLGVAFLVVHHYKEKQAEELSALTEAAAGAAAEVDVLRAGYAPKTESLTLPGEARGWYESTIYARVSGYIGKWLADIGDRVKKDQILCLIETPELDEQLNSAKAQVEADMAEVDVAQANKAFADQTYDRYKTAQQGVVSELERDKTHADFLAAESHLAAVKKKVALDQADVKRLSDLKDFQRVTAPYDGVITARHIDIGDLVTAGSISSTTSLYDMAQSDQIRIFVDVPQSISPDIRDQMPATATAREYPGRVFEGIVARNSNSIDAAAKTLRVEVDFRNKDFALKPGMYLEVHFQITTNRKLVRVPAGAMNFRSSGPQVAVVKNGVVEFRPVSIARDLGNFVDLDSGVLAGEEVAININSQIADGDKVTANLLSGGEETKPPTEPAKALAERQK
jgi:RND family efflux transporter MFP subunit